MNTRFRLPTALIVTASLLATTTIAADWPRFRGPNGAGTSTEKVSLQFSEKELLWKTAIPGVGHSSPVIVGKNVYLQTAAKDGSTRSLLCVNAETGKITWSTNIPGHQGKTHKKNTTASGTPACDGERVFAGFWDGEKVSVLGFDLEGKILWTTELGTYASQHGFGHSPIIYGGLVIVNFDQDGAARLVALDAKTGKEKWSTKREAHRASYSTPILLERDGKTELIVGTTTSIDGYEPDTGKVKWSYPIKWESGEMPLRAVAGPVMAGDLVLLAMGDGGGSRYMVAVNPTGTKPAKVWDTKKDSTYVPCPLIHEGYVYWVNDSGLAICAEAKTGKVQWSERVFSKGVSASPILVNGVILAIAEDGKAIAFKASPKEIDRLPPSSVGEAVFASPAVANGRLFIRGASYLFCYGSKAS